MSPRRRQLRPVKKHVPVTQQRPMSRAYRARQITTEIREAACRGLGTWWSQHEAAHAAAVTPTAAAAAAAPALALCAACPSAGLDGLCALRAELDNYTGLAAGAAWVNGTAKRPSLVRRLPTPPGQGADLDEAAS